MLLKRQPPLSLLNKKQQGPEIGRKVAHTWAVPSGIPASRSEFRWNADRPCALTQGPSWVPKWAPESPVGWGWGQASLPHVWESSEPGHLACCGHSYSENRVSYKEKSAALELGWSVVPF